MNRLQITHIKKPDRYSPVDRIELVAGPNWGPVTLDVAVRWANTPGNSFYVLGFMGAAVPVKVMPPRHIFSNEYLQTVADYTPTNNLLSLPEITSAMYSRR